MVGAVAGSAGSRRRVATAATAAEVREHRARTVGRVTDREAVPDDDFAAMTMPVGRADVDRHLLRASVESSAAATKVRLGSAAVRPATQRGGRPVGVLVGVDALGVGECVPEARLSRLVLRTGLGAEEGRDGDRDQNGNDQHHDHELDERETTLVVLTPSPQVRKHVLHCDVPLSGRWIDGCDGHPVARADPSREVFGNSQEGLRARPPIWSGRPNRDGSLNRLKSPESRRSLARLRPCGSGSSTSRSSWASGCSTGSTGSWPGTPRSGTPRSSTSATSSGRAGLEAHWPTIRARARRGARAARRPAELPGHLDRPGHDHRRRPVEDLLPLRVRLPLRRQLRALPRDRPPRGRGARDADGDVLDPGARQAHPRAQRPVQGRDPVPPRAQVPRDADRCRIRVGDAYATWREGESLIFDDTYEHEVWNDTDEDRVVLFLDVVRPLRFPMNVVNAIVLKAIAVSPFIQDAKRRHLAGRRSSTSVDRTTRRRGRRLRRSLPLVVRGMKPGPHELHARRPVARPSASAARGREHRLARPVGPARLGEDHDPLAGRRPAASVSAKATTRSGSSPSTPASASSKSEAGSRSPPRLIISLVRPSTTSSPSTSDAGVAGVEPAVDERRGGRRGIVEVAVHQRRAADDHLAGVGARRPRRPGAASRRTPPGADRGRRPGTGSSAGIAVTPTVASASP